MKLFASAASFWLVAQASAFALSTVEYIIIL